MAIISTWITVDVTHGHFYQISTHWSLGFKISCYFERSLIGICCRGGVFPQSRIACHFCFVRVNSVALRKFDDRTRFVFFDWCSYCEQNETKLQFNFTWSPSHRILVVCSDTKWINILDVYIWNHLPQNANTHNLSHAQISNKPLFSLNSLLEETKHGKINITNDCVSVQVKCSNQCTSWKESFHFPFISTFSSQRLSTNQNPLFKTKVSNE